MVLAETHAPEDALVEYAHDAQAAFTDSDPPAELSYDNANLGPDPLSEGPVVAEDADPDAAKQDNGPASEPAATTAAVVEVIPPPETTPPARSPSPITTQLGNLATPQATIETTTHPPQDVQPVEATAARIVPDVTRPVPASQPAGAREHTATPAVHDEGLTAAHSPQPEAGAVQEATRPPRDDRQPDRREPPPAVAETRDSVTTTTQPAVPAEAGAGAGNGHDSGHPPETTTGVGEFGDENERRGNEAATKLLERVYDHDPEARDKIAALSDDDRRALLLKLAGVYTERNRMGDGGSLDMARKRVERVAAIARLLRPGEDARPTTPAHLPQGEAADWHSASIVAGWLGRLASRDNRQSSRITGLLETTAVTAALRLREAADTVDQQLAGGEAEAAKVTETVVAEVAPEAPTSPATSPEHDEALVAAAETAEPSELNREPKPVAPDEFPVPALHHQEDKVYGTSHFSYRGTAERADGQSIETIVILRGHPRVRNINFDSGPELAHSTETRMTVRGPDGTVLQQGTYRQLVPTASPLGRLIDARDPALGLLAAGVLAETGVAAIARHEQASDALALQRASEIQDAASISHLRDLVTDIAQDISQTLEGQARSYNYLPAIVSRLDEMELSLRERIIAERALSLMSYRAIAGTDGAETFQEIANSLVAGRLDLKEWPALHQRGGRSLLVLLASMNKEIPPEARLTDLQEMAIQPLRTIADRLSSKELEAIIDLYGLEDGIPKSTGDVAERHHIPLHALRAAERRAFNLTIQEIGPDPDETPPGPPYEAIPVITVAEALARLQERGPTPSVGKETAVQERAREMLAAIFENNADPDLEALLAYVDDPTATVFDMISLDMGIIDIRRGKVDKALLRRSNRVARGYLAGRSPAEIAALNGLTESVTLHLLDRFFGRVSSSRRSYPRPRNAREVLVQAVLAEEDNSA